MRVRKAYSTTHPLGFPWRWEAAGLVGYCMTRMGALRAARRAEVEARNDRFN